MTPLIVHKTQLIAIGLAIEAPLKQLPQAIPAIWKAFFSRQHELASHFQALGVSLGRNGDMYYEFVGALVPIELEPPIGMRRLLVPANRYIRVIHEGPVAGITTGFGRLLAELAAQGLKDSGIKLDIGYSPGLPAARHELYVGIARFMPPQLGPVIEPPSDETIEPAVEGEGEFESPPTD